MAIVTFQQSISGYSGCTDVMIDEEFPTVNQDAQYYLRLGKTGSGATRKVTLIKWLDLGIPAGASIVSATITFRMSQGGYIGNATAFLLKRAWVELEATWNIFSTGNNWDTPGCLGAGVDYWSDVGDTHYYFGNWVHDITNIFKTHDGADATRENLGYVIIDDEFLDWTHARIYPSEAGSTQSPILTVTYETAIYAELTDGIKVGDSISLTREIQASLVDGLKAGDSRIGVRNFFKTLTDGAKIGDSALVNGIFQAILTDGAKFGDSITPGKVLIVSLSDGVKVGDITSASGVYQVSLLDGVKVGDLRIGALLGEAGEIVGIFKAEGKVFVFVAPAKNKTFKPDTSEGD